MQHIHYIFIKLKYYIHIIYKTKTHFPNILRLVTSWRSQSPTHSPKHLLTFQYFNQLGSNTAIHCRFCMANTKYTSGSSVEELGSFHWFTPSMSLVQQADLNCKCHNSQYRSREPCIGHVSSSIHNRSAFIPLSRTSSRFIHCHSCPSDHYLLHQSIYTAVFLSHCSHLMVV